MKLATDHTPRVKLMSELSYTSFSTYVLMVGTRANISTIFTEIIAFYFVRKCRNMGRANRALLRGANPYQWLRRDRVIGSMVLLTSGFYIPNEFLRKLSAIWVCAHKNIRQSFSGPKKVQRISLLSRAQSSTCPRCPHVSDLCCSQT